MKFPFRKTYSGEEDEDVWDFGKKNLQMEDSQDPQDQKPHGHDYIVTAMAPGNEPERILSEDERIQEGKEEANRKLRQDLSLLSTEQCALHFDEIYPGLGELIRKHVSCSFDSVLILGLETRIYFAGLIWLLSRSSLSATVH